MFRAVLFTIGVALLIAASAAAFAGWPVIPAAVLGAIMTLGLLFERYVYKPIRQERPGPEWEQTTERFIDPSSGRSVTVYFDPRTGERRYVDEANG
ncbi:MAG TPA: hypothetical protein VHX39_08775 [Acetobacteraceae bacterium]|jgi:hypothetical protein|nr:hypothetical protein [Acetobacteraceae bacterium]